MASRNVKRRYYILSTSSDSDCSIPVYRKKQFERITVERSNLKKSCDFPADKDDNSGTEFISRKNNSAICAVRGDGSDESNMFESRSKENARTLTKRKRKYTERVKNFRRKHDLFEDSCDSSASSDGGKRNDTEYSGRKNRVEAVGGSRRTENGTIANKHVASNSAVTSNPLKQSKPESKKNQEAVPNIRHHVMKMMKELKYILSKFKLKVEHLQLKCVQDGTVRQDGKDIMFSYNSIIKKLKEELTVQQQSSMGPYRRCGETAADTRSSSETCSASYKRPNVTKISKPGAKNNVNERPVEANCTSAVTVVKNVNPTSKDDESLTSILSRLKDINVVKAPSRTSVAGSINTVPNLEVLHRAYRNMAERRDRSKQDSLRNSRVKQKGLPTNYDSDVNSTCSTVAYPARNANVQINNYRGGLIRAGADKNVARSTDVPNRDVSNRDILKSPISDDSLVDGEVSDEIPLTNVYSSDLDDTIIIPRNDIRNLKHWSKDHIPAQGKTALTSSNSENIRSKQPSEFVVPDVNNLSTKYRSHHVAISNREDSVPEGKPTEQNQYSTPVDEKLRMNCEVVIEKFKIIR